MSALDDDYDDAATRAYEFAVTKEHEYRNDMLRAMGDGELTYTGAANESRFFSQWVLVEDVLKEIDGLEMVHLTINGSHEKRPRQYGWEAPDTWEVIVIHSRGCYSRYFYT